MNNLIDNEIVKEVLKPEIIPERNKTLSIFVCAIGVTCVIMGLIIRYPDLVMISLILLLIPAIFLLFHLFWHFTWSVSVYDKKLIINDYAFNFYLTYDGRQEISFEDIDYIYYLEKEYSLLKNYRHKLLKYNIPKKEMDYRKENLIKKYKVPNEVINSFEHSSQKTLNDYTATGVLMALENILDKYKILREEKKKIIKALKTTDNFNFEHTRNLLSAYSISSEDLNNLKDEISNCDVNILTPFLLTKLKITKVERMENQGRNIGAMASVNNTLVFSNRDGMKKVYLRCFHSLSRTNWHKLIHIINQNKFNVKYLMTSQYYRNISDPNFKPGCG
jgi:hypothetical protein